MNNITLDQAKTKVLEMNNKTLENFVNQRIGNDSELSNFARNELADRNNFNSFNSRANFKRVAQILEGSI